MINLTSGVQPPLRKLAAARHLQVPPCTQAAFLSVSATFKYFTHINTTCTQWEFTPVTRFVQTHFCASGLSKMHDLTSAKARPIRFRAWLWNETEYTFQFDSFQVLNKSTNYTLKLDNFNSSASSAVANQDECKSNFLMNANQEFSTFERDNDLYINKHCAQMFGGAGYWYDDCTRVSPNVEYCASSNCGTKFKNIKLKCLMGDLYSVKKFQIDVFIQ